MLRPNGGAYVPLPKSGFVAVDTLPPRLGLYLAPWCLLSAPHAISGTWTEQGLKRTWLQAACRRLLVLRFWRSRIVKISNPTGPPADMLMTLQPSWARALTDASVWFQLRLRSLYSYMGICSSRFFGTILQPTGCVLLTA